MKEERLKAIKAFCKFIDNYEGDITVRNSNVYNDKNELIYTLKVL